MNQLRSLIIISFGIALFVGNTIGLDVFEHFCSVDNTASYSYIIPSEDHCFDEHEPHNNENCCVTESTDKGCCEDEIIHVHLDLDYANQYSAFNTFAFLDEVPSINFELFKENVIRQKIAFVLQPNPPPLEPAQRRSLHQVFIV